MATINAKKYAETLVVDTERNFIRIIEEILSVIPQYQYMLQTTLP